MLQDHDSLVVVQYHFLSWPDHMVPMYACTLISFINCIRSSSLYQEDNSPMVVHCSAGIGRTGAFIVIDSMLRMAEKEKKIDVFGHFCKVRQQRINMVEKFAQYRFVYQVLLEALSHDPTDISCIDFATYLDRQTKGSDKTCLLYKQYEVSEVTLVRCVCDIDGHRKTMNNEQVQTKTIRAKTIHLPPLDSQHNVIVQAAL